MNPQTIQLLRRGLFFDAEQLLARLSHPSPEESVSLLEATYYLGDLNRAQERARELRRVISDRALSARIVRVLAGAHWDFGDFENAIALSRDAHQGAVESRDSFLVCRTAVDLLERTCNYAAFSASLPLSALARRSAFRTGDAQALALVHLVHARLEGRAGTLGLARRHLDRCHALLASDENVWMLAAVLLDESHVVSMTGDIAAAISLADRGANLAEQAGWSKGVAAGAANLASLHLLRGDLAAGRREANRASNQIFSSAAFRCALNDTYARIDAAEGHRARAEELLRQCREPAADVPVWYRLKAAESLVGLLLGD